MRLVVGLLDCWWPWLSDGKTSAASRGFHRSFASADRDRADAVAENYTPCLIDPFQRVYRRRPPSPCRFARARFARARPRIQQCGRDGHSPRSARIRGTGVRPPKAHWEPSASGDCRSRITRAPLNDAAAKIQDFSEYGEMFGHTGNSASMSNCSSGPDSRPVHPGGRACILSTRIDCCVAAFNPTECSALALSPARRSAACRAAKSQARRALSNARMQAEREIWRGLSR